MKQILETSGQVPWSWLEPHFKTNRLFLISQDLSLPEAALAVAQDDQKQVSSWITRGLVSRPTIDQVEFWSTHGQVFEILIVQPYVLAQLRTQA